MTEHVWYCAETNEILILEPDMSWLIIYAIEGKELIDNIRVPIYYLGEL